MTHIVLDAEATTDPAYGQRPEERSIEQRIASGVLLLDKPAGPTSHQVTAWVRDSFGLERMGHGGTLDPFATGVLPLTFGKSMRLTGKVLTHDKTYISVLDVPDSVSDEALEEGLSHLRGRVYNVPPEISAVKVQVRTRRIERLVLLSRSATHIVLEVACEAGTYIRTMARDLGLLLDRPVKLVELRRSASGRFDLSSSATLQQVADAHWLWSSKEQPEALLRMLHPIEILVEDLPKVVVRDAAVGAVAHGAPLMRPGVVSVDGGWTTGSLVAAMTLKGELIALMRLSVDSASIQGMSDGEVAKAETVVMTTEVYPRSWTSPEA
jgi:H/ACA ribonucleoprotein complex subunit 4